MDRDARPIFPNVVRIDAHPWPEQLRRFPELYQCCRTYYKVRRRRNSLRMSKRSQAEIIELLRGIDSPTIANAIEAFKVRKQTEGYASRDLKCMFPELPPIVGYAVTCIADTTSPEPTGPNRLLDLFDAVGASPKPAVVVIQQQGPNRPSSCVAGDIVASSLTKLGVAGLITDAGVRDLAGMRRRAPGFQ